MLKQRIKFLNTWYKIPGTQTAHKLMKRFTPFERMFLYVFSSILITSSLFILLELNKNTTNIVPSYGGSITEGLVGTPRFINPLLAISDTDRDLTMLAYSGLMRATATGELIPDLAKSIEISEDGLTYTFTLKDNITFHDGTPITASDVKFTVALAQSPDIKSPKRADWEGVIINEINSRTISFTLQKPYAPFIENTTIGILPKHLWKNVSPEEFPFYHLNTNPIGSGPYKIARTLTSSSGSPTKYIFKSFENFALGKPFLNKLIFIFFNNEEDSNNAMRTGLVDSVASISPTLLQTISKKDVVLHQATLPRIFAIFLNQNNAKIFSSKTVRSALDTALDKQKIINYVLNGYGTIVNGPIPPKPIAVKNTKDDNDYTETTKIEKAQNILDKNGWDLDKEDGVWKNGDTILSFSLSTSDTPELIKTSEYIAKTWRKMGAKVKVEIFPVSDLSTNVIRPRSYQALLFGEIVGRTLDLFAFWHSSQRSDPGLNLAIYTNSKADKLLSQARSELNKEKRNNKYIEFSKIIKKDSPAIFLYAPDFLYITPKKLKGVKLGILTTPAERFLNVYEWYMETERVWGIFGNTKLINNN